MVTEPRRQATAIELSAMLFQAVVVAGPGEREAAESLAQALGAPTAMVQLELLHVRAVAVEMALQVGLNDGPAATQLRAQYADRWREEETQDSAEAWELLQERLQDYAAAVEAADASGLEATVGRCFASLFGPNEMAGDLAHLGGRLFGALLKEVSDLLTEVELIALEVDDAD